MNTATQGLCALFLCGCATVGQLPTAGPNGSPSNPCLRSDARNRHADLPAFDGWLQARGNDTVRMERSCISHDKEALYSIFLDFHRESPGHIPAEQVFPPHRVAGTVPRSVDLPSASELFPERMDFVKAGGQATRPKSVRGTIGLPQILSTLPAGSYDNGLEYIVEKDSTVKQARIFQSSGISAFDELCVATVLKWKFVPANLAGTTIPWVDAVFFHWVSDGRAPQYPPAE